MAASAVVSVSRKVASRPRRVRLRRRSRPARAGAPPGARRAPRPASSPSAARRSRAAIWSRSSSIRSLRRFAPTCRSSRRTRWATREPDPGQALEGRLRLHRIRHAEDETADPLPLLGRRKVGEDDEAAETARDPDRATGGCRSARASSRRGWSSPPGRAGAASATAGGSPAAVRSQRRRPPLSAETLCRPPQLSWDRRGWTGASAAWLVRAAVGVSPTRLTRTARNVPIASTVTKARIGRATAAAEARAPGRRAPRPPRPAAAALRPPAGGHRGSGPRARRSARRAPGHAGTASRILSSSRVIARDRRVEHGVRVDPEQAGRRRPHPRPRSTRRATTSRSAASSDRSARSRAEKTPARAAYLFPRKPHAARRCPRGRVGGARRGNGRAPSSARPGTSRSWPGRDEVLEASHSRSAFSNVSPARRRRGRGPRSGHQVAVDVVEVRLGGGGEGDRLLHVVPTPPRQHRVTRSERSHVPDGVAAGQIQAPRIRAVEEPQRQDAANLPAQRARLPASRRMTGCDAAVPPCRRRTAATHARARTARSDGVDHPGEVELGAAVLQRPPQRLDRGLSGPWDPGARSAEVVAVRDRARHRRRGEHAAQPALLRRARAGPASQAAVGAEDDDLPGVEPVGVDTAPSGLRQRGRSSGSSRPRPACRTRGFPGQRPMFLALERTRTARSNARNSSSLPTSSSPSRRGPRRCRKSRRDAARRWPRPRASGTTPRRPRRRGRRRARARRERGPRARRRGSRANGSARSYRKRSRSAGITSSRAGTVSLEGQAPHDRDGDPGRASPSRAQPGAGDLVRDRDHGCVQLVCRGRPRQASSTRRGNPPPHQSRRSRIVPCRQARPRICGDDRADACASQLAQSLSQRPRRRVGVEQGSRTSASGFASTLEPRPRPQRRRRSRAASPR